jgi:hypothetical protein
MAEKREICEEYAKIGAALIHYVEELEPLREATIIYLRSNTAKKSKGSLVYGQCEKVQDRNKWAIPADFTITVFEPNVEKLTEEQVVVLLYHELLHANYDAKSQTASINPHDFTEFNRIIDRFGARWYKEAPHDIEFLREIMEVAEV